MRKSRKKSMFDTWEGDKKFSTTEEFNYKLDTLFDFKKCSSPRCTNTSRHFLLTDGKCQPCIKLAKDPVKQALEEKRDEEFGAWS